MSEIYNGMQLPQGWLTYTDDEGRSYFHNPLTNTTQWNPPSIRQPNPPSSTMRLAFGGGGAAVLRENGNELLGYGSTDGVTAAPVDSSGKGRVVRLSALPPEQTTKKKGYASLPDDLTGSIDLESGKQQAPSAVITPSESQTVADPGNWCWFVNIVYLQSFFDTDTKSVLNKILSSMLPYKIFPEIASLSFSSSSVAATPLSSENGVSPIRASPDFYGPFWIPTSLIFLMFISSNIAAFISGTVETNFLALVVAFSMLYGYLVVVPLTIWAMTLFLGGSKERESITIRQLVSVYGYSFSLVIPMAIISIIPSMLVRWMLAILGSAVSFLFVSLNFKRDLIESEPTFKIGFLALLIFAQTSFYLTFPLYYFGLSGS